MTMQSGWALCTLTSEGQASAATENLKEHYLRQAEVSLGVLTPYTWKNDFQQIHCRCKKSTV